MLLDYNVQSHFTRIYPEALKLMQNWPFDPVWFFVNLSPKIIFAVYVHEHDLLINNLTFWVIKFVIMISFTYINPFMTVAVII